MRFLNAVSVVLGSVRVCARVAALGGATSSAAGLAGGGGAGLGFGFGAGGGAGGGGGGGGARCGLADCRGRPGGGAARETPRREYGPYRSPSHERGTYPNRRRRHAGQRSGSSGGGRAGA